MLVVSFLCLNRISSNALCVLFVYNFICYIGSFEAISIFYWNNMCLDNYSFIF